MKLILLFLLLALLIDVDAVGVKAEMPALSTAKDPNFGHSNAELWNPRGRRNKRWYFWYRRYYGGYSRRSYYYYYNNYYNNYYSYYYGKKK